MKIDIDWSRDMQVCVCCDEFLKFRKRVIVINYFKKISFYWGVQNMKMELVKRA